MDKTFEEGLHFWDETLRCERYSTTLNSSRRENHKLTQIQGKFDFKFTKPILVRNFLLYQKKIKIG
jgi:hypothetical protein